MSTQTFKSTFIQQAQLLKKAYFQAPDNHRNSTQFEKMLKIVERLQLQDFNIPEEFPAFPTQGVVFKEFGLRISLFFIPKGSKTFLHDHPKMYVINKVLKGSLKKTQYSLETSQFQQQIPQKFINTSARETQFNFPIVSAIKTTQTISNGHIDVITPEDNLHRFQTSQNSIFIDIIAPDYDDVEIFYNTYVQIQDTLDGKARLQMGPPKLQQNYMIKINMK